MADNEQKQTAPVQYTPPSQLDPAELTKLFVEDGVITPEKAAEVAGKPATQEVAKPAPVEAKKEDEPQLLKIAREKDAFRKEKEAVAPHLDMLKAFSPQEAQRLAQARASGDPVAALAALGFTHSQYTQRLVGMKPEEKPADAPAPEASPKLSALEQELAALKAERENERAQANRREAFSKMETVLKDNPKFSHVSTLKEFEAVERVILQHWNKFGELPGATFEESVALAAEVVEADLKKQAEKYRPLLTTSSSSAQVSSKAPESPRPASESPRTLTNANTTAPAAARTTPRTLEEIKQAIANGEDLSGFET